MMPVGFRVIEQVAGLLSETEARVVSELAPAVGKTPRAVRYALNSLMSEGRVRRHGDAYYTLPAVPVAQRAQAEAS
jgi:predicted transcriptional regulator